MNQTKLTDLEFADSNTILETALENHSETQMIERNFRAIIENSNDGISILGADGKIKYVTPSVERIMGYSSDTWINTDPSTLAHPDEKDEMYALFGRIMYKPGATESITYRMLHKDGSWRWLKANVTNMLHNSDVEAFVFNYEDYTEKKLAEEKIKEAQAHINTIFDNTADGFILLDKSGTIKSLNTKAKEMLLLNADEEPEIGAHLTKYLHPERISVVNTMLSQVLTGEHFHYDQSYQLPGNEILWLSISLSPVYAGNELTGICITGRNITARKLAEEQLERNEKLFRALIEHSEDAIVMMDAQRNVIYQSASVERIFGYGPEDIMGKRIVDLLHPDDQPEVARMMMQVFEKPGVSHFSTYRIKHKDGHWIWSEGSISNQLNNNNIKALVINFRDVSQRIEHLHNIEMQNKILREINWTQSHVVRAPLARIMGLVNLLQAELIIDTENKEILKHISTASEELNTVIKDIIKKAECLEVLESMETTS